MLVRYRNQSLALTVMLYLMAWALGVGVAAQDGARAVSQDWGCQEQAEQAFPCKNGEWRETQVWLEDGTSTLIYYQWIDGKAIFEGDIILPIDENGNPIGENLFDLDQSTGRSLPGFRWPGHTVVYAVDPNLPDQQRVLDAINHWETTTCMRFIERTTESDYVFFTPGSGCSSFVGRIGGKQDVVLGEGCDVGTAIHEIGHAVGLWHEQSRSDRDSHVIIHWANIESGQEHNFQTYIQRNEDGMDIGSYDFQSIMHYGSDFFSKNDEPTITRVDGSEISAQRDSLSTGDVGGVRAMYPAELECSSPSGPRSRGGCTAFPQGDGYTYEWSASGGVTLGISDPTQPRVSLTCISSGSVTVSVTHTCGPILSATTPITCS